MAVYHDDASQSACVDCGRTFVRRAALTQHRLASSRHHYCLKCERDFGSEIALGQHRRQSSKHNWCNECHKDFDGWDELREHYIEEHHYCEQCKQVFWSETDLTTHKVEAHFYCAPCDRSFRSHSNLDAHRNSSTHKPRNIICPLDCCSAKFTSIANIVLHWEQDKCPSEITRRRIDRLAIDYDVDKTFTNPVRRTGTGAGIGYPFAPAQKFTATECEWNGDTYRCYLCDDEFPRLQSLKVHLASPRHNGAKNPLYHCPYDGCDKNFRTLGNLLQHVDSKGHDFEDETIQNFVDYVERMM